MMKAKDLSEAIRALEAEARRLSRRVKARVRTGERDRARWRQVDAELRCLRLREREGVPDAVRIAYRVSEGQRGSALNDATGTLLEARRTWATVDFGTAGRWRIPLKDLQPAGEEQGYRLTFSANGA